MIVRGYLPEEWNTAKHYLRQFAAGGSEWWTYDELKHDVRNRRRQLWLMDDGQILAAGLTRLIGNGRVVYIDAVHGKQRSKWATPFHTTVRDWGRAMGASEIRTRARRGWAAEAGELGYRETHREYMARIG